MVRGSHAKKKTLMISLEVCNLLLQALDAGVNDINSKLNPSLKEDSVAISYKCSSKNPTSKST